MMFFCLATLTFASAPRHWLNVTFRANALGDAKFQRVPYMAKTKTTTTDKSESPVTVLSADLQIIDKAGQSSNARKAVQAYQRACSDYGALIARCGKGKHVSSSLSRKNGTVKELSELDCSTLSKDDIKRLGDCIRIKKAWATLTGEF